MVRKDDPQGVDLLIDRLQVHLDTKLSELLGNWENNHRAYKNRKRANQDGIIAEVYTRLGEYRECFYDDNFDSTSFFITDDVTEFVERKSRQRISWILQLDLGGLYGTNHRPDEEVRNDVLKAFKSFTGQIEIETIETGIDRVYAEFNTDNLKYDDMSNVHVLRVNFIGQYDTTCCADC